MRRSIRIVWTCGQTDQCTNRERPGTHEEHGAALECIARACGSCCAAGYAEAKEEIERAKEGRGLLTYGTNERAD